MAISAPDFSASLLSFLWLRLRGVLVSNRINTWMSAAPLSPASALSSLKLHRSTSLSDLNRLLSPSRCFPSLLSRSLRSLLSSSSPVSTLPLSVSPHLSQSRFALDPLTRNLQLRGRIPLSQLREARTLSIASSSPSFLASMAPLMLLVLSTSTLPSAWATREPANSALSFSS